MFYLSGGQVPKKNIFTSHTRATNLKLKKIKKKKKKAPKLHKFSCLQDKCLN